MCSSDLLGLDSQGNLYVVDPGNRCIRRVTPAGLVTTVAGQPGQFGSAVGIGSEARFFWLSAMAINSTDQLFIADDSDNVIRMATLAGGSPPALKVTRFETSCRLSWSGAAAGVVLEQRATLSDNSAWAPVQRAPTVENGEAVVVIPIGTSSQFFRLLPP